MFKGAGFIIVATGILIFFSGANAANAQECNPRAFISVGYGQKSAGVKNTQACLIAAGFNIPYGATGYYGAQTRQAVKDFYNIWYGEWNGNSVGPRGRTFLKSLLQKEIFTEEGMKKFSGEEEFKLYLAKAEQTRDKQQKTFTMGTPTTLSAPMEEKSTLSAPAERVSETTVQVKGIDEPDIVKTDGSRIYFSHTPRYYFRDDEGIRPLPAEESSLEIKSIMPLPLSQSKTKTDIIQAFPPTELKTESSIEAQGNLLLVKEKKTVVIFSGDEILSYNVADPKNPQKKWDVKLGKNTSVEDSRLLNGKIYVVMKKWIDQIKPCGYTLFSTNNAPFILPCPLIYHPTRMIPVDVTFTAAVLNPETGAIESNISFVGSSQDSVIYMSPNALYVTYSYQENPVKIIAPFFKEKGSDLVSPSILSQIEKLQNYEISDSAKIFELETIMTRYLNTLTNDERLRINNELTNRLQDYYEIRKRELEKTAIVKIVSGTETSPVLAITSQGNVPGFPVNQFALDEYNGNLRIATTVGQRGIWFSFGGFWPGNSKSVNDVYVLDGSLKEIGSVKNLGLTERVYSARFIGDRGYLVTFRQIDPFYVLDMTDPRNPAVKGELKIPGYSSYLQPLALNKILGIGQESSQVKASLFDVSDAQNPKEIDKYLLSEGWSEVLSNHRAFLLDEKHQVFFLPGGQGGYIFSYKDDKLKLLKTVSGYSVKRAVFLDDYLYVIAEDKIVVFNENDWTEVNMLELK